MTGLLCALVGDDVLRGVRGQTAVSLSTRELGEMDWSINSCVLNSFRISNILQANVDK